MKKIRYLVSLMRDFFKVKNYAINYFRKYGLKNLIQKGFQIARSGGLAYFDSKSNVIYSESIFENIQPRVLLVSNDFHSPSHEYRVSNISQALWESSISNLVINTEQCLNLKFLPKSIDLVYFWRTSLEISQIPWWLEARESGVKIAYDSDDLTFETATYNFDNVHALKLIPKEEAIFLIEEITLLQEKQVKNCDIGIAGTPELQNAFTRLSKTSIPLPIVIPRWMQYQGEQMYKTRDSNFERGLSIVYCSGSRSHNLDFQSCSEGVFNFLREHPTSSLTLQGASPMSREEIPQDVRNQVFFYPMVPHQELLPYIAQFHVQLAPLEMGNPFVAAKSATKFMQGGIVGVPTIASPTEPFQEAIKTGINGYLASNHQQWQAALEKMNNREILLRIGEQAHADVVANHCVDAIKGPISKLEQFLTSEPKVVPKNLSQITPTKVTWLLPNLVPGSGGHRNVFRLANLLEGHDFKCQIYFYSDGRDAPELLNSIVKDYGPAKFEVIDEIAVLRNSDILVGVHNSSIPFLKRTASRHSKLAYLVQDFEPWFNPMSESYLEALSTYFENDLSIFTSGAWMSRKLKEVTGKVVPYFDFPVDRSIYKPSNDINRDGILFFAKQDTPRRLFEVGRRVLREVYKSNPHVKIEFFGSLNTSDIGVPAKNAGLIPTLEDLASKYQRAKIGMAFSPTNPSLVPYEMMACGLPVIDVDLPGEPMHKYGENYLLKPATYSIESMTAKAISLLSDKVVWEATSTAGIEFIKSMPTPEEVAEVVRDFFRTI